MDIGRVLRLINIAQEIDSSAGVAVAGQQLIARLNDLVSYPAQSDQQLLTVEALDKFRESLASARAMLTPEELDQIDELAGGPIFSPNLADDTEEALLKNAATPAVARDYVSTKLGERDVQLANFRQILSTASALAWNKEELKSWEAEIGFKIPRHIFDNQFDRLIGELKFLRRFLADISEIGDKSIADIQLASLSTTDPIIAVGVGIYLAREVGKLITWALDRWKTVEEIRQLRDQSSKVPSFTEQEIEAFFGDKIKREIQTSVDAKVEELAASVADPGRRNELSNALNRHLNELLGRIERGMTVEVRFIGHHAEGAIDEATAEAEADIGRIASGLKFPPPSPNPILQITKQEGG